MFARVITARTTADQLDLAIGAAREQLPAAQMQPGYRGFYLLVDRETGTLMTVSFWATRQDAEAVESQAAQLRSRVARAAAMPGIPAPDIYQVAAES